MKKGSPFMPAAERVKLVRSIECVDAAIEAFDDDRTCCKTVKLLVPDAFTNGGDQNNDSIPEAPICREIGCELIDGLGGKVQVSISIIDFASRGQQSGLTCFANRVQVG
jgi:bifunctional ADP-heptose synthase (sugar kinase/adenylyltransferase)